MDRHSVSHYGYKSTDSYFESRVDPNSAESINFKFDRSERVLYAGIKINGTWLDPKPIASW